MPSPTKEDPRAELDVAQAHFNQGSTALKSGQLRKAEQEFKAVLEGKLPPDVGVMTYFSLGELYFARSREAFNPEVPWKGKAVTYAKKAHYWYEYALVLDMDYPTSPTFPEYQDAVKHCGKNWDLLGAYLDDVERKKAQLRKEAKKQHPKRPRKSPPDAQLKLNL